MNPRWPCAFKHAFRPPWHDQSVVFLIIIKTFLSLKKTGLLNLSTLKLVKWGWGQGDPRLRISPLGRRRRPRQTNVNFAGTKSARKWYRGSACRSTRATRRSTRTPTAGKCSNGGWTTGRRSCTSTKRRTCPETIIRSRPVSAWPTTERSCPFSTTGRRAGPVYVTARSNSW